MTDNQDSLAGLKAVTKHLTKDTPEEKAMGILLNAKVFLLDLSPTNLMKVFKYLQNKCSVSNEWWEAYKDEVKEDRKKKPQQDEQPTQSELLLQLAAEAELFHTSAHEGFARVPVNEHEEVWPIQSKGFRRWLLRKFYQAKGRPPQSEALQATLSMLEAQALFDGHERQVWLRVAEHEGNIYIDLGNPTWDAVEITPHGWQVVADYPVCFRRSPSMLPLPYPEMGGSIDELRPFLNVTSDSDFILKVAFILAAMRPRGPYPISVLNGEQGSAKTTTARVKRSLIDPNISPVRSVPREERDLMIAANNSWVLGYDNLSGIPNWLSDAFCRISTGGGISNRELYTNREESILDAMRPVILNGIDSLTERPDLADRALIFNLTQISDDARRPEKEFWIDFQKVQPRIIGALLNAVSMGLRNQNSIKLSSLPRMADFALWIVVCESALPWPPGSFMTAYTGNRQEAVELSLEADAVAVAVRAHMADKEEWSGTPSELYNALENYVPENTRKSKAWPKAPHWLSNRLKRAATFLRVVGLEIEFGKSGDRNVSIAHQRRKSSVQSVQSAQTQEYQGDSIDAPKNSSVHSKTNSVQSGNGDGNLNTSPGATDASSKVASIIEGNNHGVLDGLDATDAFLHTISGEVDEEDELLSGRVP